MLSLFFFNFYFYFILLYNTVLVLPYIDMNLPWVYMSSQSWTPLPPPTPYHLSGSSPCTSPKHPVSCIGHRLAIHFLHDSIHVSVPFSQIIPPSPSESKSQFSTSVSLLLSCIQGKTLPDINHSRILYDPPLRILQIKAKINKWDLIKIRVFSNESSLRIRWPKYWSFSINISPSNEYWGLISFRMNWLDLLAVQGTVKSLLQQRSSKASIL